MNFSYNSEFSISTIGVNGSSIDLVYDKDNLLIGDDFLTISRDQNGLVQATLLNGNSDTYTYNAMGEVETYNSSHYSVVYTRDNLGRITNESGSVNGSPFNVTYDYDLSGRLSFVNDSGSISNYFYDSNSNRLGFTYDDQDRLISDGTFNYAYKPNGELQSKTRISDSQLTTFNYDEFGNLNQVVQGANTIDYVIDPRNRRVGKKINGTLVKGFLYKDQLNPIAELNPDNSVKSVFLYGTKPNVPDYMLDTSGTIYRIISNHLGSVKLVVNTSDNQVMQQLDYDVWGNITNDTNPGFQPFGFAGGIYDEHTGLTRLGARDYDPVVARWTAKDPIRFLGGDSNLFGFVTGDPVNKKDSSGTGPLVGGLCFGGLTIKGGLVLKDLNNLRREAALLEEIVKKSEEKLFESSECGKADPVLEDINRKRKQELVNIQVSLASAYSDLASLGEDFLICTILYNVPILP